MLPVYFFFILKSSLLDPNSQFLAQIPRIHPKVNATSAHKGNGVALGNSMQTQCLLLSIFPWLTNLYANTDNPNQIRAD